MAITEVKDSTSVMLGLGTLGMISYPAGSPQTFVDVGYIKSCAISYNKELKDFTSAGVLVKRLIFRDTFSMKCDWAEVSVSNLNKIIPGSLSNMNRTIAFGGSRTITRYLTRFEHTNDDGRVVTVDMYKATPAGEFTLNFAEEEYITYPVEFQAEADSSKPTGQQYGRIRIE